jgi:arylsulfatase A-like enzyme
LFWYWKNKIASGVVSNHLVSNYDFLNTLAEIVGVDQIKGKDGVSYAKTLFGGRSKGKDYTIFSSTLGPAIVTQEGWKLRYVVGKNVFQLYYLPNDYEELKDLSKEHPKKLEMLKTILFKECDGNWENGLGPIEVRA